MKTAAITVALFLIALPSPAQKKQTAQDYYQALYKKQKPARNYYHALYKAGQLDPLADTYACFVDLAPTGAAFYTFGESTQIRDRLKGARQFDGLPKEDQDLLNRDIVILRSYKRNSPSSKRLLMTWDGKGWTSEVRDLNDEGYKIRELLGFDPSTLHFGHSWETIAPPPPQRPDLPPGVRDLGINPEPIGNNGVCEHIPIRIQQHGQ